jgi:hypothetical protein
MTATYWLVGRRIVEGEQRGKARARYGEALIKRLSEDLSRRFGRGFSMRNLEQMRRFYLAWPIPQAASAESRAGPAGVIAQTASAGLPLKMATIAARLPLPWSHYVRLLSVENTQARSFY